MKRHFRINGDPYYKYMLCYVDDFIRISFKPQEDKDNLNIIYRLKEGFGPPDQYLGANVEKVQLEDGQVFWSTNCVDYLKSAIENLYNTLGENNTAIKNCGMGVGHTHPDSGQNYMSLKNLERN